MNCLAVGFGRIGVVVLDDGLADGVADSVADGVAVHLIAICPIGCEVLLKARVR